LPRSFAAAVSDDVIPFTGWSSHDPSVVDAGRRTPPALPKATFGSMWEEFNRLAQDKGAPVDYVALGFIVTAASIIGGKRKVQPYEAGTWREPPILWLGLVGDPSFNKSPALDPLLGILRKIEMERADEHREKVSGWQADCERAKIERQNWQTSVKEAAGEGASTPPLPQAAHDQPRRRRLFVQDATPESMGEVLAGNPQGTLLIRDELDGWLSSFDRYNPGGRSFWLEAFGGRPYTIDRKANPEPLTVTFNGVSIIGGIQPQKLADSLLSGLSADDGLAARFLWIWPNRPTFARPQSDANILALETALRRLDNLEWGIGENGDRVPVVIPLEPAAADAFEAFQRANRDHEDDASGMFKSFIGKLPGVALRLSLVAEFAEWGWSGGLEPRTIRKETVEAVADFLESYAMPMAARVFGDAALPPVERNAATIARWLLKHGPKTLNARELRRTAGLPGLREANVVRDAIDALVEASWLRPAPSRNGDNPGRQRSDFIVNPAIYGAADV
jgi:putative DNA primase/helicase